MEESQVGEHPGFHYKILGNVRTYDYLQIDFGIPIYSCEP